MGEIVTWPWVKMQVTKVPDQKLADQVQVRLQYEFSQLEILESLGEVLISSPGKSLGKDSSLK